MCIGRVYFCYRFAFALVAKFAPPKFADVGQKVARRGSKWPTARGRVGRKNEPSNWAFETEKKKETMRWGETRRHEMGQEVPPLHLQPDSRQVAAPFGCTFGCTAPARNGCCLLLAACAATAFVASLAMLGRTHEHKPNKWVSQPASTQTTPNINARDLAQSLRLLPLAAKLSTALFACLSLNLNLSQPPRRWWPVG